MPRVPPLKNRSRNPNDDLGKAVKTAFMYRWNLLAFLGGVGAALLSGHPDIFLPLVGAAEMTYLGGMVSFPKFRKAVAREGYQSPNFAEEPKKDPAATLAALVTTLPPESRKRFDMLRARCLEMREIAQGVRGRTGAATGETIHTPALDRLLWVFLRLLVSQNSLKRFLGATSEAELQKRAGDLQTRLEAVKVGGDERLLDSLTDSLAVAELRLENYQKARANAEFVEIELDRIEAKIQALTEMSINRHDPDFLSSQVDAAAESMTQTETTITELQNITGLVDELEEPPPILEASLSRSTHVA
jgi:hypothetical protein